MITTRSLLQLISFLLIFTLSAGLSSQENPNVNDPLVAESTVTSNPYYLTLGNFLLRPEMMVAGRYDSNIFTTRDDETEDSLVMYEPNLLLTSNWDRHLVKINMGGEFGRYDEYSTEDYDDYWLDLQGRYDFSDKSNVFGGVNHTRDHEESGAPDVVGTTASTFDSDQAHAGLSYWTGNFDLRIGATFERLDFDHAGQINNSDRNRDVIGDGVRLNYKIASNYEVFAQYVGDLRAYDTRSDDNGFNRNSNGYRLGVGMLGQYSNRLSADAYIGRLNHEFDDARFNNVDVVEFNANLKYLTDPRSHVTLALDRSLEETTLPGASSYLYSVLSVQATRQLSARDSVIAGISAGRADYRDVELEEDIVDARIEWQHRLSEEFFVSMSYRMLVNDTNEVVAVNNFANPQYLEDSVSQQITLALGTLLFNVKDPGFGRDSSRKVLNPSNKYWQGFYIGAQAGYGVVHLTTSGVRDDGTDRTEFGDQGAWVGPFMGYALSIDRWFIGLEAEVDRSNQDTVKFKSKPASPTFNIQNEQSYAISLRGGYAVASGPLLSVSAGRAQAEFDTFFAINDDPANVVNETFDIDGLRYSVGADIPVAGNTFLRVNYSYTDYETFDADVQSSVEKINPDSTVFRIGLGRLFGSAGTQVKKNDAIDFNGFYSGLRIGHSALDSELSGVHEDGGSMPGTFDFDGEFGNNANVVGGLFAGYGHLWNQFYLGFEAEVEAGNEEWEKQRSPSGRYFSLRKKSGLGAGLRLGYQLHNGTLLYLSSSRMRTRFVTTWIKGENRVNNIERDDKTYGDRIGAGIDIPVSQHMFMRLNYTVSDYETYDFVTEHGSPDTMRFDNSDSQLNLGIGVNF